MRSRLDVEWLQIQSDDFWGKVVGMLQQNWALIETEEEGAVRVYFITDTIACGVSTILLSPP